MRKTAGVFLFCARVFLFFFVFVLCSVFVIVWCFCFCVGGSDLWKREYKKYKEDNMSWVFVFVLVCVFVVGSVSCFVEFVVFLCVLLLGSWEAEEKKRGEYLLCVCVFEFVC